MFYTTDKIALLIDGIHVHGVKRDLEFDIDYKKLMTEFARRGRLARASYFTTILEDTKEYCPMRPLIDWLGFNGFALRTKPARVFYDESGNKRVKRSMLVEIAMEAMELADHVDHIVIFSGDGDLRAAVEAVQRKGVRVSICSSINSGSQTVSDDLRRQADNFIEMKDLQKAIQRDEKPKQGGQSEEAA